MRVHRGSPYPLGATWDGRGVNVAVFSEVAEQVELCLFDDPAASAETQRIALPGSTGGVRHGYFPDLRPGQLYGLRVSGPYRPEEGPRCNPHKLLFDPYAKAVGRDLRHDDSLFGYDLGSSDVDLTFNLRDSAGSAPLAAVIDSAFTWGADTRPRRALADTVIYELHVKGFTRRHPGVPEPLRGTYAGLASPAAVEHLLELGVTAVELLPVHYRVSERFLVEQGLSNYWGYNTLGFFAPDPRLAAAGDPHAVVREFKTMVATLHDAGIAVLLDVVYNHTAEGSERGPTLAFRGLDNAAYYHLADERRYTYDVTGTGNTLNVGHPRTLQLITDSLRYWVSEMHVDGFRFDLAPALAREYRSYDRLSSFFDLLLQDPVLAQVHLIAEPWDVGDGGYEVGNFPVNWSEWNGRYRDTVRSFWKGDEGKAADLASRLSGSADIYNHRGRRPWASVNFITAHDGFSLRDLVSYNGKHNEANHEENRDGSDDNLSWNCGAEGPTDDEGIKALRRRQMRNLLSTLLLSEGVPMLLGGDEIGRSQGGNNNTYCQDSEIGWIDWGARDDEAEAILAFTKRVIALRHEHVVFRRSRFFTGQTIRGTEIKDVTWLRPDGAEMSADDWAQGGNKAVALLLSGESGLVHLTEEGEPERDLTFLMVLNASDSEIDWQLPEGQWEAVIDTTSETEAPEEGGSERSGSLHVAGRCLVLLARQEPEQG
jgi:glycogen operon protein